jgi:hypothetical protein
MLKNFSKFLKISFLIIITFIYANHGFAGNFGDTTEKEQSFTASNFNKNNKNLVFKSLEDLDKVLNGKNVFQKNESVGFPQKYFDDFNAHSSGPIDAFRDTARAVLDELEKIGNFLEFLVPSDLGKRLPIGFTKRIGNQKVTIAISSIIFTPKYAELTVFARVTVPQSPGQLFFGVKGIKLSYNGGIIGDARLTLLGDITLPINGKNSSLKLKGGFDINTGQSIDKTYITFDCEGFKNLRIDADVEFPRNLLLPVNPTTGDVVTVDTARVKGSFAIFVANWNDIIIPNLTLTPFQVKGLKDINFSITNAVFDFSDFRNSDSLVYPPGYQQKYLNATNPELWRGVYVKNLTVSLPRGFKDKTKQVTERVFFGVNDMIIDNNGFTGTFFADNVLPLAKGNAGGWKFSVDSIRLAFETNNLMRAGFGGKVGIPLAKDDNTTEGNNKKKYLSYGASIGFNGDFVLNVATLDSLSFDIWKATVLIKPNSYVQLKYENNTFYPEAMLHGSMNMTVNGMNEASEAANPSRANIAVFKGIKFESLNIKSVSPYITVGSFGIEGELKIGQFPLSVNSVSLSTISPTEMGVSFNVKLTLQDGDFTGSTGVTIIGSTTEGQGIRSWRYSRLRLDSVIIHANVKDAFILDGYVRFMDNHPVYGDGWQGGISLTIKKGVEITAGVNVVFGKTTFRYWYIDAKVTFPTLGVPVAPPLPIYVYGLGGGAYYRMTKNGFGSPTPFGTSINYIPDSTAGLGLKAAIYFSVVKKKLINAEASFEIAFNRGGGLKFIGVYGYARVMADIPGIGGGGQSSGDFVTANFKNSQNKESASGFTQEQLDNQKMFQPALAAERTYASSSIPGESGLEASMGIQYDFNSNTLHATFDMYINAAEGLVRGRGTNNRAGWAVLHISPTLWYMHVGTPTDKIGVSIGLGPLRINTGAYFMLGQNLPPFPAPPPIVVSILQQAGLTYTAPSMGETSSGTGVAFGASIDFTTGDIRFLMLYARFSAGLGFDVMLSKFDDTYVCTENNRQIGIKGWWAQGQAYAYLSGELGIRIKIGPIKKNVIIIRGSAAALVEAKLPNPTWFRASVAVNVNVLGIVRINVGFQFTAGRLCNIASIGNPGGADPDNPFDEEIKAINTITPENNATNKSLFIRPQINFKIKPGSIITADNVDGPPDAYRPNLEYCKIVTSAGVEVPTEKVYNAAGDLLTLRLAESLNPNTVYKVMTKLTFSVKRGNQVSWVTLTHNGAPVEEINDVTFTTGVGVDSIPLENCIRMYPFAGQKFLYPGEATAGSVELNVGVSSIFSQAPAWKARFINIQTGVEAGFTSASYTSATKKIAFGIPPSLPTATNYRIEITKATAGTTGIDSSKPALTYRFRTSNYSTLSQKILALQTTQNIVGRVSSDIINLQSKVQEYEGFEQGELIGNSYTGYQPLIKSIAIIPDNYYVLLQPLIYRNVPLNDSAGLINFSITNRNTYELGIPPVKAINVSSYYLNSLNGYYGNYSKIRLPFIYNLPYYYYKDFQDLRTQVINHYLQGTGTNTIPGTWTCTWINEDPDPNNPGYQTVTGAYQDCVFTPDITTTTYATIPNIFQPLVASPFPFMPAGNYKVKIQFVGVDNVPGTFAEYIFNNPIE